MTGLSKKAFKEKEDYFERNWAEIVTSTEDCINLIDDGEEQGDEQIEELNYQVGLLKTRREQWLSLEGETERNLNIVEVKNMTPAKIDAFKMGMCQLLVTQQVASPPLHSPKNLILSTQKRKLNRRGRMMLVVKAQ